MRQSIERSQPFNPQTTTNFKNLEDNNGGGKKKAKNSERTYVQGGVVGADDAGALELDVRGELPLGHVGKVPRRRALHRWMAADSGR